MTHKRIPHTLLRPDYEAILAADEAREAARGEVTRVVADLVKGWSCGEISTLCKVLKALRRTYAQSAEQYRELSICPRPAWLQGQIDFWDHGASALDHVVSCLERCGPRRK